MLFDVRLFAAAVGRIHQDNVETVVIRIVEYVLEQAVVVEDLRNVQIVQQHIRDAKHVRELLFLDAVDRTAAFRLVIGGNDVLFQLLEPGGDEAARAAGEVRHLFTDPGLDHLRHEFRNGAGRVVFARAARALQLFKDGFIDLAEGLTFLIIG